jgi:hypothetical protein
MTKLVDLTGPLQQGVLATVQQQAQAIADAARPGAVSTANQLVFFAAFDGTNNDLTTSGHEQNTNVAQLFLQAQSASQANPELLANYYPGPGTKGTLTESAWLDKAVTGQVGITAEKAYGDFARQASAWLETHPGGSATAVLTSFSRGVASAAIFTQLLNARGLIDPIAPHKVLIPPGQVKVSAGVIFDPVATGVTVDIAFASNVSNVVNIRAQDDYRQLFKAVNYSAQKCVKTIAMLGNHCDIGGGYDNGISALTLEAATTFFRNSGLQIAPVAADRQFSRVSPIAIHTEEFDDFGQKQWDVYLPGFESAVIKETSPRLFDPKMLVKMG